MSLQQADPRLEQAKQLLKNQDRQAARLILEGIIRTNPNETEALYLYALTGNNAREVEKALRQVLELDPFHYRAKAALNKLQQRSVAQLPTAPPPTLPSLPPAPLAEAVAPPRPAKNQTGFYVLAMVAIAILASVGVLAVVVLAGGETDDPLTATATALPQVAQVQTEEITLIEATVAELAATWTPLPTSTIAPTRTLAPTMTMRPSATPVPSLTPTPITVAALTISLPTFSRLFVEYRDLSAQTTWTTNRQQLTAIQSAFEALIASLELSEYDEDTLDEKWLAYLDEISKLLARGYDVAVSRDAYMMLMETCLETNSQATCDDSEEIIAAKEALDRQTQRRLDQERETEAALAQVTSQANATAEWEEQINALRTPSSTPRRLPSATPMPLPSATPR